MRLPCAAIPWLPFVLVLLPLAAPAATLFVASDGSGDYPNIQAAIDVARDGDVIQLGYGRFAGAGNRDLSFGGKAITVRSSSTNPETCIIDCEGNYGDYHRGITFDGEDRSAVLANLTIAHGYVDGAPTPPGDFGGGVLMLNGASPTITNVIIRNCGAFGAGGVMIWSGSPKFVGCRFENNGSCGGGGAYCFDGSPEFVDCRFVGNHTSQSGGGLTCRNAEQITITNCEFIDNSLYSGFGGAISLGSTSAVIHGCTFIGNRSHGGRDGGTRCVPPSLIGPPGSREYDGGAICLEDTEALISYCTFVDNDGEAGGAIATGVYQQTGSDVLLQNCILAFNDGGGAVSCALPQDQFRLTCCDLYQNVGGDWTGCIADQSGVERNISENPLFCDFDGRDLTLDADSPCAPQNSAGCYQIGAWPVGCNALSAVEAPSRLGPELRVAPNPTVGPCRIELRATRDADDFRLRVVDVSGRLVRFLDFAGEPASTLARGADESESPTGETRRWQWDGRDAAGRPVTAGIYFIEAIDRHESLRRSVVVTP